MNPTTLYHVTLLSNLARAYDRYAGTYSKASIPESRFPDRFFLLRADELAAGIAKGRDLLSRTALVGDRLLVLRTLVDAGELHANTRTGVGQYVARDWLTLAGVHSVADDETLTDVQLEEALAASLRVLSPALLPYDSLVPRSVSILPVALGCQAACPFCYSKASASVEQATASLDWGRVRAVLQAGRERGAERAVITGGGEPGLLPLPDLVRLVGTCAEVFPKVVLITNGYFLQRRIEAVASLRDAGLSVLSVSRHHHDDARNADLMRLDTRPQVLAASASGVRLRWVCVLQRGGIDSPEDLAAYLDWVSELGVEEVCFKELYVSTSQESVYHERAANEWSRRQQVPLRLVLDFARDHGWSEVARLPWGAPIYRTVWRGRPLQVAAYTEPSLFWERTHGLARSWNLMADGRCLASLEDRGSEVLAR